MKPSHTALAACVVALVASCGAPIGARRVGYEEVYRELTRNALDGSGPSARTQSVLHVFQLEDRYFRDKQGALRELFELSKIHHQPILTFALAELSYEAGRRSGSRDDYFAAALFASEFLFPRDEHDPPNPFGREFRIACDLYNRSLALALTADDGHVELEERTWNLFGKPVQVRFDRSRFLWPQEAFRDFVPADVHLTRGLSFRVRDDGLGVPLVGLPVEGAKFEMLLFRNLHVPATAFLLLEDDLHGEEVSAVLELVSPSGRGETMIEGVPAPLEVDHSTPLALSLETSRLWGSEIVGFFMGEEGAAETRLSFLQPYVPGRVPVVFVHGTASSAARWGELLNGLLADKELRSRVQFLFFSYPTGNPVLYSAAHLREALVQLLETLDPEGTDPALRDMVLVGHSQGGLLARLMVVDSLDELEPPAERVEEAQLTAEQHAELDRYLSFDALPFVERVVFLASTWLSSLFGAMIEVAGEITGMFASGWNRLFPEAVAPPTSIASMAKGSYLLERLERLPFRAGVPLHSVIAVWGSGPVEECSDGVVEYTSAHLDQAESEVVVRSTHSMQGHPDTVLELNRILRAHVGL